MIAYNNKFAYILDQNEFMSVIINLY